jgi:hypothetical protein
MAQLTQSAEAGSCLDMDGYVQGNRHRVDDMIFERNPSFFKIKVLGTDVFLLCPTTPMYNAS